VEGADSGNALLGAGRGFESYTAHQSSTKPARNQNRGSTLFGFGVCVGLGVCFLSGISVGVTVGVSASVSVAVAVGVTVGV